MSRAKTKRKREHLLANESIGRLLYQLSMPAIIGMLVQAFYNIIDTIFIGHVVGSLGIAGLSIVFPVQIFIFAIMSMVGIGCATLVSIALGAKEKPKAELIFGNALIMAIVIGCALSIIGIIESEPLLKLFGATTTIMPYAKPFMQIVLIGLPFISFAATANNVVRAEGNAKTAMIVMLLSAAINTILDVVFILWLKMGVQGAAIATVIAQIFSGIYLLIYFLRGKSILLIKMRNFRLKISVCQQILTIGFPSFVRIGIGSLTVIVVNNLLGFYGGDISIAAYGIINRIIQVSFMPIFGVAQGMQPILGFNYGAKQYARAHETVIKTIIVATIISCIPFVVIFSIPHLLMSIFTSNLDLIAHATHAIKLVAIMLPFLGLQVIGASMFQSIGKAKPALLLSLSRRALFFLPLLLIMPKLLHLNGIWISFPISDILSAIVVLSLFIPQLKAMKDKFHGKQKIKQIN